MYIQTPKRYARSKRRRYNLISLRTILVVFITVPLIFIMVGIYENREAFAPMVNEMIGDAVSDAGDAITEINAPPPTPTRDPSNDLNRADAAWDSGAIQEAVNLYQRSIEAVPNDLTTHYKLTLGLIIQGQLEEALVAAENTVTANPFSADAWAIRSMALNRLDRNGEAIASAQQALEIATRAAAEANPAIAVSRARAQAFLAEAYLNIGRGEGAENLIGLALETYPDSFEAYQVRGRINQEYNFDLEAALADYRTAYELAPNFVYPAIWYARLERDGFQNYEVAVDLLQELAEKNPDNTQILTDLGNYYLRVDGNYPEAASYLSRCITANPEDDLCHYLLGRTRIAQQQIIEAQNAFQAAIELNGNNGYYYYWLAETYIVLGQCPQALPHLQTGYDIAQETQDALLIDSFEPSLQQCGSPLVPAAEVTPEITAEPEGGDA